MFGCFSLTIINMDKEMYEEYRDNVKKCAIDTLLMDKTAEYL